MGCQGPLKTQRQEHTTTHNEQPQRRQGDRPCPSVCSGADWQGRNADLIVKPQLPRQRSTGMRPLVQLMIPSLALAAEKNRLLGALASAEQAQIGAHLEPVCLHAHEVLAYPDEPLEHVYFPCDAVVTLLVPMEAGVAVGGDTIGNEGLVGLGVFLGDAAPNEEMVVQIPGEAVRMRAADFRRAVARSGQMQMQLQRYTLALINQLGRTAGCNRLHSVDKRCARWLMMSRDRGGRDTFPLTHEPLARTLG